MSGIIAQNTLDGSGLIKSPEGGGAWNFIKKLTASGDADLSFVNGASDVVLDSTYKTYVFTFNNIHPETDSTDFGFNISIDSGSNYNVTKTTTFFRTQHYESGTSGVVEYLTGNDIAEGTGEQFLHQGSGMGTDNVQCIAGYMYLFDPSSTTFVKHFISTTINVNASDRCREAFLGGYANTTSAVDALRFKMTSGNIDLGDICLYGIST